MNNYVPNILFYAGSLEEAKSMQISANVLKDKLLDRGIQANFGILNVFDIADINEEDALISDADIVLYWFNNHVFDEDLLNKKLGHFFSHCDKGIVGCWPRANIRPVIDEIIVNCPDTLDEIASYVDLMLDNSLNFHN